MNSAAAATSALLQSVALSITGGSGSDSWRNNGAGMTVGKDVNMLLGDGAHSIAAGCDIAGKKLTTVKTATFDGGAGLDHLQEHSFVAAPIVIVSFEDLS